MRPHVTRHPLNALIALLALALTALGPAAPVAGETSAPRPSICSLQWPEVSASFRSGNWELSGPPVVVATRNTPDYQAQVFEHNEPSQMALVIAEWGAPDSMELGAIVYCTVRAADGTVVEEIGRNPLLCRGADACV
jgi:hypothetical protein